MFQNMSNSPSPIFIDAIGKPCPMPLLMLKKSLKQNVSGHVFIVKASDPHSQIDLARYCQIHHLSFECTLESPTEFHYRIEN